MLCTRRREIRLGEAHGATALDARWALVGRVGNGHCDLSGANASGWRIGTSQPGWHGAHSYRLSGDWLRYLHGDVADRRGRARTARRSHTPRAWHDGHARDARIGWLRDRRIDRHGRARG